MEEANILKPVRVCVIGYSHYYLDARIKNYVHALLEHGYEVDVFGLGNPVDETPGLQLYIQTNKPDEGGSGRYFLSLLKFLFWALVKVGLLYSRRRYQLVHVHNMPDFLAFSALVPKIFGAKVILDIHDTMPELYAAKFNLPLTHPMVKILVFQERLSAMFSNLIITTHDLHRESLIQHGLPADKIRVIVNFSNQAIFKPVPERESHNGLTLVYHGTISWRLGLDLVVEAVHKALPACPGLRLLLIGHGDQSPRISEMVQELQVQEEVKLIGWVPYEEIPSYLAQVDAGIIGLRSIDQQRRNWGLPGKMLEYAAMEIPTIAPRLRVIEQYFDDQSAIFYQPDSSDDMARLIERVYQNREILHQVRQNLKAFNRVHNWQDMERTYLGLIEDLLAGKKNRPPGE